MEQDLGRMYHELYAVKSEIAKLSDVDLYDLCLLDIQLAQRHDLDALYDILALGYKLTPKERKEVESFYILANMEVLANE